MTETRILIASMLMLVLLVPGLALAQAWVPPKGEGFLTLTVQSLDSGNHLFASTVVGGFDFGTRSIDLGQVKARVLVLDGDFAITDKLAVSATLGHVTSRYREGGRSHEASGPHDDLPLDDGDWHSSLQDARVSLRYMQPKGRWVFTPSAAILVPMRDYEVLGHAATGRGLKELELGIDVGRVLFNSQRPRAYLQGAYRYAFIESVGDVNLERGNLLLELGYLVHPSLTIRGFGDKRTSHRGGRILDFTHHDQLAAAEWVRLGAGVSIRMNEKFDLFVSVAGTLEGENTHDATTVSVGSTWSFQGPGNRSAQIRFPPSERH